MKREMIAILCSSYFSSRAQINILHAGERPYKMLDQYAASSLPGGI